MLSNHHSQREQNNRNHNYTKENLYLDRIGQLMGTDRHTLNLYGKIKLWEDGENYQKVVKYVNNSQCHPNIKLTVVNIHRVWRRKDEDNLFHITNRQLLWHGTKRKNIPNILDNGFLLPQSYGQMFGAGIYFADRISKSSNYSDQDITFLLLCEVGLGKMYSCKQSHNEWTSPPAGYDSVKANGTYVPDWTDNGRYYGSLIPFGKTAKCTKYTSHAVNFNEFIVFDPKRVIIRFLVEVQVKPLTNPVPLSLAILNNYQPVTKQTNSNVQTSKVAPSSSKGRTSKLPSAYASQGTNIASASGVARFYGSSKPLTSGPQSTTSTSAGGVGISYGSWKPSVSSTVTTTNYVHATRQYTTNTYASFPTSQYNQPFRATVPPQGRKKENKCVIL